MSARRPVRSVLAAAGLAVGTVVALAAAPAQAAVSASIYPYCLWNSGAGAFTTSVRAFGSSPTNTAFSVYRDGVKVAVFYAPRPGWWLETVPAGAHTYEVRNYAGSTTLASLGPVNGGVCTP
mgnify:CR=1 FL=1